MTILLLSIFLLTSCELYAQVTQEWVNRYNHTSDSSDYGWSVATNTSGDIFAAGQVYIDSSQSDICLVKYNSAGMIQWVKTFNGPANEDDYAHEIVMDNFGNIYLTGAASRQITGVDFCTIKFNSSGDTEWVSFYNSIADSVDEGNLLTIDNLNNIYVTGSIKGNSSDIIVVKYNSSGAEQWVRTYNGPASGWDRSNGIEVDDSSNVYVLGFISTISSSLDYCTIKYNSAGTQQWLRTYNGTGNNFDLPNAIVLDDSANVYITGTSGSISGGDFLTIKYDRNGNVRWTQRYNGPANNSDAGSGIAVDDMGNVYAFGESIGLGSEYDWLLIKYNSGGIQQWFQRYNGPGNNHDDADVILTDNNNVYVMGASTGIGSSLDYLLIKYNSEGIMLWQQRYNGTGNDLDFPTGMNRDSSDNIYLTGNSMNGSGNMDIVTIKYSQSTSIIPMGNIIPENYILNQNYPNPFNPATTFEFQISNFGFVTLKIYNNFGKEVSTLVAQNLNTGTYKVEFDASNLSSGIYFYTLKVNDFIETKKMMLIR